MSGIEVGLGTVILVVAVAVGTVVALAVFIAILRHFLFICRPNEILINSGRKHHLPDGSTVGYKVVRRGWATRTPLLETVSRMDMRLFMVEVSVTNAYSKAGIPLDVKAIANVKISSNPSYVRNAVERFLGTNPGQIAVVARQTLEGVLREVLAQLTPEEVNQDRLKFAETLKTHAQDDFDKLGLELDVLMIRDAQNAENEANQKIAEEQAGARQRAESAQKKSEASVLQKKNQLRTELAKMEAQAKSIENEAAIAAETARATAEQELQRLRAELEKARLQCDVVLPAEAARQAAQARARGEAAPLVENGKAAAAALQSV